MDKCHTWRLSCILKKKLTWTRAEASTWSSSVVTRQVYSPAWSLDTLSRGKEEFKGFLKCGLDSGVFVVVQTYIQNLITCTHLDEIKTPSFSQVMVPPPGILGSTTAPH